MIGHYMALIKREFWENKGAFRTTPLVICGIYIVLTLMFLIALVGGERVLFSAEGDPVVRMELEKDTAIPGQPIVLTVTLLVPTWMPSASP